MFSPAKITEPHPSLYKPSEPQRPNRQIHESRKALLYVAAPISTTEWNIYHLLVYIHVYCVVFVCPFFFFSQRGLQRARLRSADHLPTASAYTPHFGPVALWRWARGTSNRSPVFWGEWLSTKQAGRLSAVFVSCFSMIVVVRVCPFAVDGGLLANRVF